jgi:hypothetical protein
MLVLLAAWNLAHVVAYATTRFRLPLLPVLFLFAATTVAGRRDSHLAALRGWRVLLLALLVALAGLVLWPGLEELALWRSLVGLPPL